MLGRLSRVVPSGRPSNFSHRNAVPSGNVGTNEFDRNCSGVLVKFEIAA